MKLNLNPTPELITFDTYGTLIDWESAIIRYIEDVAAKKGETLDARQFYRVWYYAFALPALKGTFILYRELLHKTFQQALEAHRISVSPNDGATLGDAMAAAEPFPDAVEALRRLKSRYRLATISNSQDDIISYAVEKLGNPFDIVLTAETTHTYKPNPALFELVLARAQTDRAHTVHVAQSQYVDLPRSVPMGIRTVWINRQNQKLLKETPAPDVILPDVQSLPGLLGIR
jgi:2-haloacid dehalogenase